MDAACCVTARTRLELFRFGIMGQSRDATNHSMTGQSDVIHPPRIPDLQALPSQLRLPDSFTTSPVVLALARPPLHLLYHVLANTLNYTMKITGAAVLGMAVASQAFQAPIAPRSSGLAARGTHTSTALRVAAGGVALSDAEVREKR